MNLGPADPLLGSVLAATYRINRRLAEGGMGRVYEAEHVRLPRRFAVKVIHARYATHEDALLRFEREARAAASIASDHVLSVIDAPRLPDGRPTIVSELLDGEDLHRRIRRVGRLGIAESIALGRQLCLGLSAAHAHGVIHRDIKPSNLFLTARAAGETTLKILDFGVSKIVDSPSITLNGAIVGTPAYMAPEQAIGSSSTDARADVYGAGAVLYRMLTGTAPHAGDNPDDVLRKIVASKPTALRRLVVHIPRKLEAAIEASMRKDPSQRPDAAELGRMLAGLSMLGSRKREQSVEPGRDRVDEVTLVLAALDPMQPA